MKYIKKVILENFQSHKYTVLDFDDKLNVIVGPSDSGKTAILRGIRWVLYNEPTGDFFIREGENYCSVLIEFNDGIKVKRYRSKSKNMYILYNSQDEELVFEGFGTSIPEEIINATGIKKIFLDTDLTKSINLSDQLEGPFLLSEKNSTRASSIGRLVGVNIIDDTIKETLKDIRNLSLKKKNIEERLVKLKDELSKYEYLEELEKRINKLNSIRDEIFTKSNKLDTYKNLNEKLQLIVKEKKEIFHYLQKLSNLDLLLDIEKSISKNISTYNYLTTKKDQIKRLKYDINYNLNVLNLLEKLSKAEEKTNNIINLNAINNQLIKYKSSLKKIEQESLELSCIKEKLKGINYIESNLESMVKAIERLNRLNEVKDRLDALRKSLAVGENYIKKFEYLDKVINIYDTLDKKVELLNKLIKLLINYSSVKKEIGKIQIQIEDYKDLMSAKMGEYKDLLLKLEVCPLCFSNIDDSKIEHILNHYN